MKLTEARKQAIYDAALARRTAIAQAFARVRATRTGVTIKFPPAPAPSAANLAYIKMMKGEK